MIIFFNIAPGKLIDVTQIYNLADYVKISPSEGRSLPGNKHDPSIYFPIHNNQEKLALPLIAHSILLPFTFPDSDSGTTSGQPAGIREFSVHLE